ncbi:DUF3500 domain-containing protein [Reichenbachiella sp. MALMAid0571]|uniref:DUF3500 domain-containing protein n=1 Tax=Reichenbachiella sp. MALMAid0571 TaxID=3143939 RepID=UPI0032E0131E
MNNLSGKLFLTCLVLFFALSSFTFRQKPASIVEKAKSLIDSFNPEQKEKAMLDFSDADRTSWTYLPAQNRRGLPYKQMSSNQKGLVNDFVKVHLSEMGYNKTQEVIALEQVLFELEGSSKRDTELYFISFFGNPLKDKVWGWSFEGHHVSLNFTIINGKISSSPRFLGSNPGEVKEGRKKGLRVLRSEEDLGMKLINSMTEEQKNKAIISPKTYGEVVTASESKVDHLGDKGISVRDFDSSQRKTFDKLLDLYIFYLVDELANERKKAIEKAGIDNLIFAWAGSLTAGNAHYYRIQSKEFLIEFDNSQNNANHIHTVWRDFDGDFGRDLIKEHYQNSNHH